MTWRVCGHQKWSNGSMWKTNWVSAVRFVKKTIHIQIGQWLLICRYLSANEQSLSNLFLFGGQIAPADTTITFPSHRSIQVGKSRSYWHKHLHVASIASDECHLTTTTCHKSDVYATGEQSFPVSFRSPTTLRLLPSPHHWPVTVREPVNQ